MRSVPLRARSSALDREGLFHQILAYLVTSFRPTWLEHPAIVGTLSTTNCVHSLLLCELFSSRKNLFYLKGCRGMPWKLVWIPLLHIVKELAFGMVLNVSLDLV